MASIPEEAASERIVLVGAREQDGTAPVEARRPLRRIVLAEFAPADQASRAAHPSNRSSRN